MSLGCQPTFCCSRRIFQRAGISQNDRWNLAGYALLTNSDGNHAFRSFRPIALCLGLEFWPAYCLMNVTLTPIGGANRLTQVAAQPKSAIRNWRRLLDSHDRLARQTVERHRSNLIKNTADGILAAVDRRGRAIRCALAFSAAARTDWLAPAFGSAHWRNRGQGPRYR
jgi:hypothetical protein